MRRPLSDAFQIVARDAHDGGDLALQIPQRLTAPQVGPESAAATVSGVGAAASAAAANAVAAAAAAFVAADGAAAARHAQREFQCTHESLTCCLVRFWRVCWPGLWPERDQGKRACQAGPQDVESRHCVLLDGWVEHLREADVQ